jgi:S1-C subfamily serine protease
LEQWDVILSVNRQTTPTVAAFQKAVKNLSTKEGILLDVIRRGHALFLSVRDDD